MSETLNRSGQISEVESSFAEGVVVLGKPESLESMNQRLKAAEGRNIASFCGHEASGR